MDANIVNVRLSRYDDAFIFEVQCMRKFSNTEAELEKSVAY